MSGYVLAPSAQEDLTSIRNFYLEAAGEKVARQILLEFADVFQKLARNPVSGIGGRIWWENGSFYFGRFVIFW